MSEYPQSHKIFLALRYLWRRKVAIILGTVGITLLGLIYALTASKVFMSRAVIYPQDISASTDKSPLSGFSGALNPVIGASHLSRVEIILNSRGLARQVLLKDGMLSVVIPGNWNPEKGGQDPTTSGNMENGIRRLQKMVSTRADVYKMTLEIRAQASDPQKAYRIVRTYLDVLNERTKGNVIRNANENREFLEGQLSRTFDPTTKEKIQDLIIQQMEKAMLLNANAFDILEVPEVPVIRESPRRKKIVEVSVIVGFLVSCFSVLGLRGLRNLRAGKRKPCRISRAAMYLFSGVTPDLLLAAAWIFLFGFFMASRQLPLRISFLLVAVKVAIPLAYFAQNSTGTLHLSDDVHYFQGTIRLVQLGFGALSIFTNPLGIPAVMQTAGTGQHMAYFIWNLWGMSAFGPHYFSAVFLNVGATFVSGWFFFRILRHAGFSERYCRAALVFFLLHWDVIVWSSFLDLKDTLVVTLSLALLYNCIRLLQQARLWRLVVIGALAFICYFVRFYVPVVVVFTVIAHLSIREKGTRKGLILACLLAVLGVVYSFRWMVPKAVEPAEFLTGIPQFLLTPLPWNLSAGYEFLLVPSILHLLLFVPAALAIPSLWKRDPIARFLLLYMLFVVVSFSVVAYYRGIRQRQMVNFMFIWMQFHALRAFARYAFRSSAELPALDGDPARLPEPRQEQA